MCSPCQTDGNSRSPRYGASEEWRLSSCHRGAFESVLGSRWRAELLSRRGGQVLAKLHAYENKTFASSHHNLRCLSWAFSKRARSESPAGRRLSWRKHGGGQNALLSLQPSGIYNTAIGIFSLRSLTFGDFCTGVGAGTLLLNTANALLSNTTGNDNTATGVNALASNTVGGHNAATGFGALQNNTAGASNTAVGENALESNTTGSFNTAIGLLAGASQTTGGGNAYIGAGIKGVAGESDACYIRGIFGQTSASGIPVLINANSKLGTTTSSKRFKEDIKPMDKASEPLFTLKPVTFRYKKGDRYSRDKPVGTRGRRCGKGES
jgi:hypothetical protein